MSKFEELMNASQELGIASHLLDEEEGKNFVRSVLERYKPHKTFGHLAIYHDSVSVPLADHEYTYSKFLPQEPAYIFFEQAGLDINKVVIIEEGSRLGEVFENSYGMEYFVSNRTADYLLAVNWYVIEGSGSAIEWLNTLRADVSSE